jgi:peptidoglycan/xylan/chitin deacetylase (PgdA/CDA1 family)
MLNMLEKPVPWPNGARVAVSITFDIDLDSILHLEHRKTSHRMVAALSLLRYDRIAVSRIVDMFRHFDIRQTFFFPAWCMEQYPDLVDCVLKGGHEIAHHGFIHESPNAQPGIEEERHWLQHSSEIIERMTGKRPRGWRAPLYDFSEHSAGLLVEEGFLYDASLMGDDVPYVLSCDAGEIIEIPSHWALDDWPQYAFLPEFEFQSPVKSPDDATQVYMAEFEAAYKYGGLFVPVWHPTVSGRLARCDRIAKMIEEMALKGDVWFATMEEIALHIQQCRDDGSYEPSIEATPPYKQPLDKSTFEIPNSRPAGDE